jgi:hypothetical protein
MYIYLSNSLSWELEKEEEKRDVICLWIGDGLR